MDAGIYSVIWRHEGREHLLDTDDEAVARKIAVDLAELGRDDVLVSGPQLAEIDPERADRVRERTWAALVADLQRQRSEAIVALRDARRGQQP